MPMTPAQLGLKSAPADGAWIQGRNYDAASGTFGEPNQIWSKALGGAGSYVSQEVRNQSAKAQGVSSQQFDNYLTKQGATQQQMPQGNAIFDEKYGNSGMNGAPSVPDINALYDKLMQSPEMTKLQADIEAKQGEINTRRKALADASAGVNDNPFYAEATRTGKLAKLEESANKDINNHLAEQVALQDKLAQQQGFAKDKIQMTMQQYEMNRGAYQDALQKFNIMLENGALGGASAGDIAQIAGATGLSSSMIYGAIETAKKKNMNPQVIMDDYGNATIMDANTGQIINTVKGIGKSENSGGGKAAKESDYADFLKDDARSGKTLSQIFSVYSGYLSPDLIYSLYNSSSKFGPAKESPAQLRKYGVKINDEDEK